jgi:hypothetical protein
MFLVLLLLPVFVQAFSIDRDLSAGEFYAAYRDANVGWRIEGSFSINFNIEFFICDEENYTRWERHENAFLYECSKKTLGKSFNFTIPYDSVWYVVFSNVPSKIDVSLKAELYYIDQSDTVQTQVSWFTRSTILTPAFIGFLLIVSAVILFGIWISRRGERFPAIRYEKILPKPD